MVVVAVVVLDVVVAVVAARPVVYAGFRCGVVQCVRSSVVS